MSSAVPATPQCHRTALHLVFRHLGLHPGQGSAPGLAAAEAGRCFAAIAAGVPALKGALDAFLRYRGWYAHEPLRHLFGAYVANGYINLNHVIATAPLPLEEAIIMGHLGAVRACLDCGADPDLVPSPYCGVRYEPNWNDEDGDDTAILVRDINDLIRRAVPAPDTASAMVSVLQQALMRRRIHEIEVAPCDAVMAPTARRKARGV